MAIAVPLCAYALGALLAFSSLDPLGSTSLPGGGVGDAVQMAWFLAVTPHALAHGGSPFATTLIDHPAVVDLADNTSVPLLGVLAAPVTLTLGPVAALNLLLRLALFGSAAAMYLLLRRLRAGAPAAFLGGVVYAFGPFIAAHASPGANLDLVAVPLPPLILVALDELVRRRRLAPWRCGLVLGGLIGAQLLVDPEVLADLAVCGVLTLGVLAVVERRRLHGLLPGLAGRVAGAAATGLPLAALLAAWPLWSLLRGPGHLRGPIQPVSKLQGFHLDLAELVLPPGRQLVDFAALASAGRAAVGSSSLGGGPEHGGYLGLPLLALLVLLAWRWRRDAAMRLGAALAAVAAVLSLGPHLDLAGAPSAIPLPEALLAKLPLLESAIPARFELEVALGVAIVLAVGLDRSARHLDRGRPRRGQRRAGRRPRRVAAGGPRRGGGLRRRLLPAGLPAVLQDPALRARRAPGAAPGRRAGGRGAQLSLRPPALRRGDALAGE